MQQIACITFYLRTDPHYLCDVLARCGWIDTELNTRYHLKLSRIIVFSLFRNAHSPTDETLLLHFMQVFLRSLNKGNGQIPVYALESRGTVQNLIFFQRATNCLRKVFINEFI